MKSISLLLFIFLSLMIAAGDVYPEETGVTTLNSLIDEAVSNNPRVQADYNNWKAAENKIKQVAHIPEPTASYAYFGENIETRVGPQEHIYGFSQKVPFPGKLALEGKVQAKNAEMFKEKYEAAKQEVEKDVKLIFYDLFWVNKAMRIVEEEKAILESVEKVAQRKYSSNLITQQDVIKVHLELSKLIDRLFILEQNRRSLISRLNNVLNRTRGERIGELETVKPVEFKYNLGELYEITLNSNRELSAANLDVERAEHDTSLARLDYFPDFTLGVDFIQIGSGSTTMSNDGQNAWVAKVAVNIPIWFDKLNAKRNEKKAALEASKNKYKHVENGVTYEVEDLYYKITTYRDISLLYTTALIPQAEQSFDVARTGYETGKVDFLNWLDAERVLLQTKLAYYKAMVDYYKSIARLERVIGRDL